MAYKPVFLNRLRDKLRKYRLNVWLLEGKEKHSGEKLVVLYAGRELNKNYLSHIAFGDLYQERVLGKAWIWSVARIARSHPAVTLIVTEAWEDYFKRFSGCDDYYIPCWIDGEIVFSRFKELMKHSENIKADLRKIRKYGYQYEITKDKDKFDLFYHTMYRPYILKAHGNRAALMSYEAMMSKSDITDLLLIKRGDDYIAGENLLYEGDSVRAWSLGVKDGDYRHVKEGAIGALYYYKIEYLISRGYDRFNAGASRAFLKDGVLQYKKKWGLSLIQARSGGFWIRMIGKSGSVDAFFENNPFIHIRNDHLCGIVFQGDVALSNEIIDTVRKFNDLPGLHELKIA